MKKFTKVAIVAALAGGAYYLFKKNQESNAEYDEEDFLDDDAEVIELTEEEAEALMNAADLEEAEEEAEAAEDASEEGAKTREQKIAELKEKASVVAKKAYGKAGEISHVVAVNASKAAKVAAEKASVVKDYVSEKLAEANGEAENAEDPADLVDAELEAVKDEASEINITIEDAADEAVEAVNADESDPE